MASALMLRIEELVGRVANAIGVPGFLRDAEYKSPSFGTTVRVKRGLFYTVVSVDGTDVYFNRFSGAVDGVGFSLASGCKADSRPGSAHSVSARAVARQLVQSRSPSARVE